MLTVTLSSKFQVLIPKEARQQLHLKVGQQFVCIPKGNGLHLVPKHSIMDFKGFLKNANPKNYRDRQDRI